MQRVASMVLVSLLAFVPAAAEAQVRILRWHTSLDTAQEAARLSGKPLFVVFRCVPCAGCREWDAQVAHGDKEIAAVREEFVCARIPQMDGVDINRFEHDFDNTWAAYFTDADLNVYSRYGGRDERGPESRLSKASLMTTMRDVLAAHHERLKAPPGTRADLVQPVPPESTTADEIPLLEQTHTGCIHCHQVQEYRLRQAYVDGKFTKDMVFGFPLPENLGLVIDREHGHKLDGVREGTPAEAAGLQAGDVLTRIADVPIRSELDVRWALHRAPKTGSLAVTVTRATGQSAQASLPLPEGKGEWKQTELGWRKSLRSVPLPLGFGGYDLSEAELKERGLPATKLALRVLSVRDEGLAKSLGLQKDDVIVAADGRTSPRTLDDFKSDLLRYYDPGDTVTLTVLRGDKTVTLKGASPAWSLDVSSLP